MMALLALLVFGMAWLCFCAVVATHAIRLYQMPPTIAESISGRFLFGGLAAGAALTLLVVFLP